MVSLLITVAVVLGAISLAVLAGSVAVFVRRWADTTTAEAHTQANEPRTGDTSSSVAADDGGDESGVEDGTMAAVDETTTGSETADSADGRDRPQGETRDAVLLREKLRAYREIMNAAVALNRAALELNQEEFRHAADAIAFDQESELREPYLDANEAFESNLYIISEEVRKATSEYVDYLATYHDDGAHAGGLLGRAGDIYEAMRMDLGLETLFGEDAAPPKHGSGDIMPEPSDEEPDVEDFTKDLGKPEDLEYFSAGEAETTVENGEADTAQTDTESVDDDDTGS